LVSGQEGVLSALALLEETIARDPQCGLAFAWAAICRWHLSNFWGIGVAYLCKRQFDQAAEHLKMAIQEHPGAPHIARNLAACYAHMGRLAEAREMFERVRAMGAPLIHEQDRGSEHENLIEAALRLAGEAE
jgi:tetratricopeptide (TPR) repeat protein